MSDTEILLGPTLIDGPTIKVKDKASGKTYYRKRILPEGTFDYKTSTGEKVKLDLTETQLKTFVDSFKNKAYDEVPFQFGKHDNDPTLRRGTLVQTEYVKGKGLDGLFELDAEAATYVQKYPNFGVSPRLVLGIDRADGKKFAGAIQHVAGTVVPRMTGMGPWEKVELSEEGDTDSSTPVIDLSTEFIKIARDRKVVNVTETTQETGGEKVFQLSEDEYNFFKNMKAEYEAIMAKETPTLSPAPVNSVELSEEVKAEIQAAKDQAAAAAAGLASIKADSLRESWSAKKQLLLSQGVPPAALDLADPVMTSTDSQVFNLSTDDGPVQITAREQMLGQLELMKGMVDLSGERGHGVAGSGQQVDWTDNDVQAWLDANGV